MKVSTELTCHIKVSWDSFGKKALDDRAATQVLTQVEYTLRDECKYIALCIDDGESEEPFDQATSGITLRIKYSNDPKTSCAN